MELLDEVYHMESRFGQVGDIISFGARWFVPNALCSMQTIHLSFIKISTISKQTELSFHLSLFT